MCASGEKEFKSKGICEIFLFFPNELSPKYRKIADVFEMMVRKLRDDKLNGLYSPYSSSI